MVLFYGRPSLFKKKQRNRGSLDLFWCFLNDLEKALELTIVMDLGLLQAAKQKEVFGSCPATALPPGIVETLSWAAASFGLTSRRGLECEMCYCQRSQCWQIGGQTAAMNNTWRAAPAPGNNDLDSWRETKARRICNLSVHKCCPCSALGNGDFVSFLKGNKPKTSSLSGLPYETWVHEIWTI